MHAQLVRFAVTGSQADLMRLTREAGSFLRAQRGFLGRDVYVDSDGVWHGVLHWADAATCRAATAAWAEHPVAAELGGLSADPAITELRRLHHDAPAFLGATQDAGRDFVMRQLEGPVDMLNLLRFRDVADYSATPELAPDTPVSGREAYERYAAHTLPFLAEVGAEVVYSGVGGGLLIGPSDERWDHVLIVRHAHTHAFLGFATNEGYLAGVGHRTAALLDSRLLPMQQADL